MCGCVSDTTRYNITIIMSQPVARMRGGCPAATSQAPRGGAAEAHSGAVSAEDGFGKDITSRIKTKLKRYDASVEEATITLTVTNRYKDTYTTEVQVPMNATGIVLTLKTDHAEVEYGSEFTSLVYVDACYDREGNDLTDRIVREGEVSTWTPGTYPISLYTTDYEGTRSITRHMTITVLDPPPEEGS